MNAVEIEEAVTELVERDFDAEEFPYGFLKAFGNKPTTIKRLRSKGGTNASDVEGCVLLRQQIHINAYSGGGSGVTQALKVLNKSPATAQAKAKFILATDGVDLEAEDMNSGDVIACRYKDFPDHFSFFLPLAGISTVKEIRDNAFDIRATSRLNRLYVELIKNDSAWGMASRRQDMNHFMARMIFCFFAEDTGIFEGDGLFTNTVEKMSEPSAQNIHSVIKEIFRAMNVAERDRSKAKIARWAKVFPYVNGDLFSGDPDVPKFSKIARSYLIHIGRLDWQKINPDIFGSMIQAVTDEEERGSLGLHYTSVPNILKVLNPLFLDDLRKSLEEVRNSPRKLLNLRKRLAKIRVFDPACGSGNFLVIAYKEMRAIEARINEWRGEKSAGTCIPETNFRGIEIREFPAEIARLALIIAKYQCDVMYRGEELALNALLPLEKKNWVLCGNALSLDWLSVCPPTGTGVKYKADDLIETPLDQPEIDFENEGGETYVCGNPPYLGSDRLAKDKSKKADMGRIFEHRTKKWKSLDYVAGWFMKAADYVGRVDASCAFVSTNSICQGEQVPILWPLIFGLGHKIFFAHTSFKWANLASYNAGVVVAIIGFSNEARKPCRIYSTEKDMIESRSVENINAYLSSGSNVIVEQRGKPISELNQMNYGNKPVDGGNLLLSPPELDALGLSKSQHIKFIRRVCGAAEFIKGILRYCLWIEDECLREAMKIPEISQRIRRVHEMRKKSSDAAARKMAQTAHQFREMRTGKTHFIIIPIVTSENRRYLPVGVLNDKYIINNLAAALYDAPLWNMAIIASRLHLIWIATVCGRLGTGFRYSNLMGWNTFPIPRLTEKNKQDLTHSAEEILVAREEHFPKTIADLYDPENMPQNLQDAHDQNDEILERVYIGRLFSNDTERLENLFDLYVKMTDDIAHPAKN